MFGYLTAALELLSPEEKARYKACYCGLCHSLKMRHGQLSRLTLNYDMTFLVLFLSSLYEPEEKASSGRCLVHPTEVTHWFINEYTDYAADMNVALAYLKLLDDWQDDRSLPALAEAKLLKKSYEDIKLKYPRQCAGIESALAQLNELEQAKSDSPDQTSQCFGELMSAVFLYKEDRWQPDLENLGIALGKFIYIMDACMDLESDIKRNRFNPLSRYHGEGDNEQRFRDILRMLMGDVVYSFNRLPLVQDGDLLKNILCCGLWQSFNLKYGIKEETSDGSGSL